VTEANLRHQTANVKKAKRKGKKKRPFPLRFRLRMLWRAPLIPELQRYAEQHSELTLHPDRYLIAWAWEMDRVDRCDDPVAKLINHAALGGRDISVEEAKAILFEANGLKPQLKSYALARWLGIPKRLALKYRLQTISGCDTPPEKQSDQRKQANKARMERERRKARRPTLAERAAAARTRAAEIAASGLSRSAFYARRKAEREGRNKTLASARLSRAQPLSLRERDSSTRTRESWPATTPKPQPRRNVRSVLHGRAVRSPKASDETRPMITVGICSTNVTVSISSMLH
jgi:hypothetical protein